TITLGNRMASEFIPVGGTDVARLAEAARLSSLADETPEGRSIVVLANEKSPAKSNGASTNDMTFIPFSATTRMSGVDVSANGHEARQVRKGAADAVITWARERQAATPADLQPTVERIARAGGTPLVVAESQGDQAPQVLGVIYLKDIVKTG